MLLLTRSQLDAIRRSARTTTSSSPMDAREEPPRCRNVVALLRVSSGTPREALRLRPPASARFTRNFYNFHHSRTGGSDEERAHRRRLQPRFAYTVFPGTGLVIATGIPEPEATAESARVFREYYSSSSSTTSPSAFFSTSPKIVNATFSGRVIATVPNVLLALQPQNRRHSTLGGRGGELQVSFRTQCFPGARLRWNGQPGTVNLFHNGRYVLVGVVCPMEASRLHQELTTLVSTLGTSATITLPTGSA